MRLGRDVLSLNLYGILGVSPSATPQQVRIAYRSAVMESHPDLNPTDPTAVERMARINVAARVLLDPRERSTYDRHLREHGQRVNTAARARAWYEHAPSMSDDSWVKPAPAARVSKRVRVELQALVVELRATPARWLHGLEQWLDGQPANARLAITAGCFVVALALIGSARPHVVMTLFGSTASQPTSVASDWLHP